MSHNFMLCVTSLSSHNASIMRYYILVDVIMNKSFRVPRSVKSWAMANIILSYGLFEEWRAFCYKHPKLKSNFRSGNLFLLHKKMRYAPVDNLVSVNMDTIEEYYYG